MVTGSFDAVLFDMDGVLVRSEEIWFRVVEEAGVRFRGRRVSREEFAPTFGQGTQADVQVFGFCCSPAELDQFYLENFARHADAVWINPEAGETLLTLKARGLRLSVVTNTMTPLAEQILAAARLREYFDFVACADQVPRAKPAPDIVVHALRNLGGVAAARAVMVGDSPYDREAARAAGVHFVGFKQEGDHRVESLLELI